VKLTVMLSGVLVLLTLLGGPVAAQQSEAPVLPGATTDTTDADSPVQVRQWVDRTAVFPGDRVNYYLEITVAPDVDILEDDLDAGLIELAGLEFVNMEQRTAEIDGTLTHFVHYVFTTFDLNTPVMQIGGQTLRYYSRSNTAKSGSPEGEVVLPATAVALRSTLAAEPLRSPLRDGTSTIVTPAGTGWVSMTGLLLILISALPVGVWVMAWLRQRSESLRQQQVVHATVVAEQGVLETLRGLRSDNEQDRRAGYDQLERVLRDWLVQSGLTRTAALTSGEIAAELAANPLPVPVDQLVGVLGDCELARYARASRLPDAGRFESSVELARRLLIAQ
jgi:hypothetical protein